MIWRLRELLIAAAAASVPLAGVVYVLHTLGAI